MTALTVQGFDHIVLRTPDVERALGWWTDVLGLPGERVEQWRRGEAPFPSVRLSPTAIIDLFEGERTGTNLDHVALTVECDDLSAFAEERALTVLGGPSSLFGAQGQGTGLYVRDVDGNTVELRTYG